MKILEGAVVTLAVTTALFMVLWGSAVRQWQAFQGEADRLAREVRTYRDAVGTLNLLLTEAQNGEPRVVAGEALRVDIIAGTPGANADDDAILADVGTPLCMPGGVDPNGLSRMIQVDDQGRVICAPPKNDVLWLEAQRPRPRVSAGPQGVTVSGSFLGCPVRVYRDGAWWCRRDEDSEVPVVFVTGTSTITDSKDDEQGRVLCGSLERPEDPGTFSNVGGWSAASNAEAARLWATRNAAVSVLATADGTVYCYYNEDSRTPVFPRDSQFIGTERER